MPRILSDVLFALSLIVWAIYRMDVLGVNLAGIVTTSTIVGGGIVLSLRETLANLWGGLALQLDNTYRIGDWVRIDEAMGQVVGIRWRYTSLATNSGETLIIPNSAAGQQSCPRAGAARRSAHSLAAADRHSTSATNGRRAG